MKKEDQNQIALKRVAKDIVLHCFRNTHLENLHAGEKNNGAGGGFSDKEMKKLMIEAVDKTYTFLSIIFYNRKASPEFERWVSLNRGSNENWNDPKFFDEWIAK